MNRSDVHEFWKNPSSDRFNAGEKYRAKCEPEYYVQFKTVSEMWVGVFKRFIDSRWSILELGCSVGRNLYYLKKAGYKDLSGVEINERAKEIAAIEFGHEVADMIKNSSIENHILVTYSLPDVVFTSGVLMHIHPESEWIFKDIASIARKFLMVAEVEKPDGLYKWPRNYRDIFEGFGFAQVHEQQAQAMSNRTTLRVFKREE